MHGLGIRRAASALAALLLGATTLTAQTTGTLSGRIVGEDGAPLTQAQVLLVGTGLGTRTSDNGQYTLVNVPTGQYRARAQLIGHRPIEVPVTITAGSTFTQNFSMRKQVLALDALVVTGTAGAARQREVGNSIAQIDMSRVVKPPANVGELLQGAAPGMMVMPSSAMAGSGSMIRLRGNVSVAMSNQPLIYVDGVRLRSDGYQRNVPPTGSDLRSSNDIAAPVNDINPNDIDRIEVIKGAAAATLYGTEAAAGVIQIFTKSGQAGKPQWTVQVDQGFSRALKFGPDPSEAPAGDTIPRIYRDSFPDRFDGMPAAGVSRAGGTSSYLFIDPWLRNGHRQRYSLSVGGGGEALRYFVSGTMTNEDGVLPLDNESKKVIRGNFSFSPLANLVFGWNTSYTKDLITNTPAGNNAHGLTLNAFRRDRNYNSNDRPENMALLLKGHELTSDIDHLITGGTAQWSPLANLTNKFTIGYDMAQIENRNLRPFGFILQPTGVISSRRNQYQTLTFDYAGNYSRPLVENLRGTLSWGGQSVTTDTRETSAYGENFPGPGNPTVNSGGTTLGFESRERVINAGLFGQTVFDFRDRYFLTLGARVDGNSAFGSDFGLQTYPKASFSWVASEEPFWPTLVPEFKLRLAWGQSGRAPGAFDAVRTWEPVGWGGQPAFFPRNVGNSELGPERTTEIEMGFDAAALDGRLSTEFTYYMRKIDQALFAARQVPSLGFLNSQLRNVGEMESNGLELAATVTLLRRRNLEWSVGGSVFTNDTKIKSLGDAADFSIGNFGWIMKDQAIPMIRTDFCVQNEDALAAPVIISPTAADPNLCNHGPNLPTKTFGVRTNIELPYSISVSANGEYMGGHHMYDGAAYNAVVRSVRWPGCYSFYADTAANGGVPTRSSALDRARCTVALTRADFFIYPADFFKLRELSVSVGIPSRFTPGATGARFTLSGHNIWKWLNDGFPVFDPETNNNGGFDQRVRSILEHVPPPATYTASLRVTF